MPIDMFEEPGKSEDFAEPIASPVKQELPEMPKKEPEIKKNSSLEAPQSKKKLWLILGVVGILAVILLGVIFYSPSQESQNNAEYPQIIQTENGLIEKSYDSSTQEIILREIGGGFLRATLDTPQSYSVHAGYNKVAQFTINSNTDFNSIIESLEFYDLNNNNQRIDKKVDLKYFGTEIYSVDDYTCKEIIDAKNGTASQDCSVSGSHLEEREAWKDFGGNLKSGEDVTIGLFTNVEWGENIEWIPTIDGVKITEWADWSNLVVNYTNYQVFNLTGVAQGFDVPTGITEVAVLIIGGGGAGGWVEGNSVRWGGGGGAGEVIYNDSISVTPSTNISIVVGAGGNSASEAPYNGSQSSFGTLIAVGGGGGGAGGPTTTPLSFGARGGSGGGGGAFDTGGEGTGGIGNATYYGNNGADGSDASNRGGGGGGGLDAGSASTGGAGIQVWNLTWGVGGNGASGGGSDSGTSAENQTGNGGYGSVRNAGGPFAGGRGGTGVVIVAWNEYVLSIDLLSPENNANLITNNITFQANVTPTASVRIQNVSLLINGTINQTNTTAFTTSQIYNFSETLADSFYNWTVYAYGNDSVRYNASNGTLIFKIDLVEPTVSLWLPANATVSNRANWSLSANLTAGNYTLNNATINVWFSNGTLFASQTNTSIAGTSDVTVNNTFANVPFGFTYLWNVNLTYTNPTLSTTNYVQAANNFTFTRLPFEVTGEQFNATAFETDRQTFFINISTINDILSTTINLNYNGTKYFTETNCVAGFCQLMQTIDIPLVAAALNENKTFFWELRLFSLDGQVFDFNTTSQQQNVSRIFLTSGPTSATNLSLNFTTWDERNRTNLTPMSFEATFDSWLGSGTVKRTNSFNIASADNVNLTINPSNRTFFTDATIQYDAVGIHNGTYRKRNYHFQNASITNTTQKIRLFLLNETFSTSFIQQVKDTSQIARVGVLIFQQRYYPEDNTFETISITKTDSSGESVGFYETEIPDYRHIITSNGTVLKTTERGKVFPTTAPFTLTFIIGETLDRAWESFQGISNIVSSLTFNQTTSIVTYEWIDTTGALTIANLTVYRSQSNQSNILFCSQSSELTAGILTCNLSGQRGSFIASGYIGRSPSVLDKLITFTISIIKDVLAQPFLLMWIIFLIATIGMSLFFPPVGIILTIFVLIAGVLLGITGISWLFIWAIIALGGLILWETR